MGGLVVRDVVFIGLSTVMMILLRWVQTSLSATGAASTAASHASARRDHAEALKTFASGAVAEIAATFVRAARDPSTPGSWDAAAKVMAKSLAIDLLRRIAAATLAALAPDDPDAQTKIASAAVEHAVATQPQPAPAAAPVLAAA